MSRRGVGLAVHVRGDSGVLETLVLCEPQVLDEIVRERLPARLKLVERLRHPGLVQVLSGGVDNGEGHPWLLEQASSGQTLRRFLDDEGHLDPLDALQVAVDLLNALEYVHRQGLLHGGLSPDQILVTRREGRLRGRILEPGLVQLLGRPRSTPFGPVRVDADYAAPEAVRGEPLTASADVYSVGLILHEALTGRHPIPAPARNRLLHRLNEPARRLEEGTFPGDEALEDRVRRVLVRSQAKAPVKRFPSARAFALALAGEPEDEEDLGEVVAPDGARCAACEAEILPLDQRTWGRHDSDRPFRCTQCERVFCGGSHWDRLGRACLECGERSPGEGKLSEQDLVRLDDAVCALPPVATPEGEGPTGEVETVEPAEVRRERTRAKARRPSERLLALRELLVSSKTGSLTDDPSGETPPLRPSAPRVDPVRHDGTGDLLVGAWEREKERRTQTLARVEEARTLSGRASRSELEQGLAAEEEPETTRLPRPGAVAERRPGSGNHKRPSGQHRRPSGGRTSGTGRGSGSGRVSEGGRPVGRPASAAIVRRDRPTWQIVAGVLSVALGFMAWNWHDDLGRFTKKELELEERLATLASNSTDAQLVGQRSDVELGQLRRQRDDARQELKRVEASRVELEALAGERGQQLSESRQSLADTQTELKRLEARGQELSATLARLDDELGRERLAGEASQLQIDKLDGEVSQRQLLLEESLRETVAARVRARALEPVVAPGEVVALGGDEPWVGGERRLRVALRWAEGAGELLEAGARGQALIALHLRLEGDPVRVREAATTTQGDLLPSGGEGRLLPGSTTVTQVEGGSLLRFWLDAAACERLAAHGPTFLVEALAGVSQRTRLVSADLVATPLTDDAALRLRELSRRARW